MTYVDLSGAMPVWPAFLMSLSVTKPERAPRILCVDDEPVLRELLQLYLKRQGFTVESAWDGLVAWEMIVENPTRFDAVITDNNMPRMTGLQLIEKLRKNGFSGRIFMFSSTITQEADERLRGLGVDAVVEKGRPISELLAALHRAFS